MEMKPAPLAVAPVHEVMREQLEYLIGHVEAGVCDCSQCQRYQRARQILLEIFL